MRRTRMFKVALPLLLIVSGVLFWRLSSMLEFPPNVSTLLDHHQAPHVTTNNDTLGCTSPSLPRGSIHIVVASYKYNEADAGIEFQENNYLWDLRLTNAEVYWYRRVQPQIPLRPVVNGPCGMTMHERLLLPNCGREGAAFVDHVLEFYENPPRSLIFLHGHAAVAWHTLCEAVFARSTYVYKNLARSNIQTIQDNTSRSVQQYHMMTLTSSILQPSKFNPFKWYGVDEPNAPRVPSEVQASDELGRIQQTPCWKFKQRWNASLSSFPTSPTFSSCCASFILPGSRVRRFPKEFYQDLLSVLMDESQPDQGRECFEYVVYKWFGDEPNYQFSDEQVQQFYDEADALASKHVMVNRMKRCKESSLETAEHYARKQKWKNKWKRFEGAGNVRVNVTDRNRNSVP